MKDEGVCPRRSSDQQYCDVLGRIERLVAPRRGTGLLAGAALVNASCILTKLAEGRIISHACMHILMNLSWREALHLVVLNLQRN